ncbi:putative phage tail protein [Romboutsia lituseburensis]|uniref:putative phage tail protein n=1 Tax=Romboutsia lituseburensis TaxID=1537 RepID=UPI0022EB9AA5|nr:putative phage tail protein [Romboutsia lituseburensis]
MLRSINLINRLPPKLQDKKEYIQICQTQDKEFVFLWNKIDDCLKDQYLHELTLNGVKRWEKIMKITPKASETLEDRRFRIINRFLNKLPYTMTSLKQILNTLCGENEYTIDYDIATFTLKIRLNLTVKNQLDEVKRTLKHIVPTNIVQDIDLLYNTWGMVKDKTWGEMKKLTWLEAKMHE